MNGILMLKQHLDIRVNAKPTCKNRVISPQKTHLVEASFGVLHAPLLSHGKVRLVSQGTISGTQPPSLEGSTGELRSRRARSHVLTTDAKGNLSSVPVKPNQKNLQPFLSLLSHDLKPCEWRVATGDLYKNMCSRSQEGVHTVFPSPIWSPRIPLMPLDHRETIHLTPLS